MTGADAFFFLPMVALAVWMGFPTTRRVRSLGESFAQRNLAYVDVALTSALDRANRRGRRGTALVVIVLATGVAFSDPVRDRYLPQQLLLLPLGGVVVCAWAGSRLRSAGRELPVPTGRTAVARARRAALTDYVPASAQVATWASVALSAGLAAAAVLSWRQGGFHGAAAALGVVGAVVVVSTAALAPGFGRAMCERPQAALDACHLYVQDAWRAEALVRAHAIACVGAFMLGQGLSLTGEWPSGSRLGLGLVPVLPLAAMVHVVSRGRLQFRRRLWPSLAPHQVLLPGDPVPPRVRAEVAA